MDGSRSDDFFVNLYKEKEIHKEHRHKHVIYKLILSSSFFGLGQLGVASTTYNLFLYVVPLIALVHDLYIFAEDYKVKRVGFFIQFLKTKPDCPACQEEYLWEEEWLSEHREIHAYEASFAYTVILTVFAAVALFFANYSEFWTLKIFTNFNEWWNAKILIFLIWLSICVYSIRKVFKYGKSLDQQVIKMKEGLKVTNILTHLHPAQKDVRVK